MGKAINWLLFLRAVLKNLLIANRAKIIKIGISTKNAFDVFNYLKNVADNVNFKSYKAKIFARYC